MSETDLIRRGDAIAAIPNGWLGQPHLSNMNYGPNLTADQISQTERWMAQKTGVTL